MSSDSEISVLEGLFGSMDYCTCEHCKSVLSPSAYLVELLEFINLKKHDSGGGNVPANKKNPLDVLLAKRPDIEHTMLGCSHIEMPYIDYVNEILEYYVVNQTLNGYEGHSVSEDDITSAELMANPQYVDEQAYQILKAAKYPLILPFNRQLEALRLLYDQSEIRLHEAMEIFRKSDDLDHITYGWRDIYNEFLNISPEEYKILTDSATRPLPVYFGEDSNTSFGSLNHKLLTAKIFSQKTGITYSELIKIINTRYINPNAYLIPKLQKLGISLVDIKRFKEGDLSDSDFDNMISSSQVDPSAYDRNVKQWIIKNYDKIMNLILLNVPTNGNAMCAFDKSELRYSLPDDLKNGLKEIDYWRFLRFIRLWKKLGLSIEETDKTITALYNENFVPKSNLKINDQKEKLDLGFKDLLIKIAHVKKIREKLNLGKVGLVNTLALWSSIDTHGEHSLYKRMFLNPTILKLDDIFDDNGYGDYLQNFDAEIGGHLTAIQAAFNLKADELFLILADVSLNESSPLSLKNLSLIYRYNFLSKSLKLSLQEFITLKRMSQIDPFLTLEHIDPFRTLEPVNPSTLRFIEIALLIKTSGLKLNTISYLLEHQDITGKASPPQEDILHVAKILNEGIVRIEQEYKVDDDPTGEIIKSKMMLIYGNDTVDKFFGLLNETTSYSIDYSHQKEELEDDLADIGKGKLTYDNFEKKLFYKGVMTNATKTDFENALSATNQFKDAINDLYKNGNDDFNNFFDRYEDLKILYDKVATSDVQTKINYIQSDFIDSLKKKHKQLFVEQTLSSLLGIDPMLVHELLENQQIVHSIENDSDPIIEDFLGLEKGGIFAQYSSQPDAAIIDSIDFTGAPGKELPANPDPAIETINAIWKFYLEVPINNSKYNFYIDTDKGVDVRISIDGEEKILESIKEINDSTVWQNTNPIELKIGRLYLVELNLTNVKKTAILRWESKGVAKEVIPVKYLYPYISVRNFSHTYLRLLKVLSIIEKLGLTKDEITFFSKVMDNESFLNEIPVIINPTNNNVAHLFDRLLELISYVNLKKAMNINDNTLVSILRDPQEEDENGEALFFKITGWDKASFELVMEHLSWTSADVVRLDNFLRMYDIFRVIKKLGSSVSQLLKWTTNQPNEATIHDVKNSIRTKYDEEVWLNVLEPISNNLRSVQRDALVAYVLHQMQEKQETKKINTPEKLFEYLHTDPQMGSCGRTNRILQAISAVQLFIERCLMNLEEDVDPSSINKEMWKYKSRYRVDEANKKIYFFNENWLYPGLRDNKTPPCKSAEGTLLQSDITDELAEDAFLHYLDELDKISKLEICDICLQKKEGGNKYDEILHVFGRVTGASQKFYHRQFKYRTEWGPWVDCDPEDVPISSIIWNGQLFLFWLNILKKGSANAASPNDQTPIGECPKGQITQPSRETVEINLCWSEYYNGRWQSKRTSDINNPIILNEEFLTGEFDRNYRKFLELFTYLDEDGGVIVAMKINNAGHLFKHSFKLFHKRNAIKIPNYTPPPQKLARDIYTNNNDLLVLYTHSGSENESMHYVYHQVLKHIKFQDGENPHRSIVEGNKPLFSNLYEAPFFYQDAKHVFFIEPELHLPLVKDYPFYGVFLNDITGAKEITFPKLIVKAQIDMADKSKFEGHKIKDLGYSKLSKEIDFLQNRLPLKKILCYNGVVSLGDVKVGPMGSKYANVTYNGKINGKYEWISGGNG